MIDLNGPRDADKDVLTIKELLKKNYGFGLRASEIQEQTGLRRFRLEKALKKIKYTLDKNVRHYFIDKEKK